MRTKDNKLKAKDLKMKAGPKKSSRLLAAEAKANEEKAFKAIIQEVVTKNHEKILKKGWTLPEIERFRELFKTHEKVKT